MEAWTPTIEEVKAYIPQRLRVDFNGDGAISDEAIDKIVAHVQQDVLSQLMAPPPEQLHAAAKAVTALGAASYVEQGLFPEQQTAEVAAGNQLERRYLARLRRLTRDVHRAVVPTRIGIGFADDDEEAAP